MSVSTSTDQLTESLEQYDDVISWINDTLEAPDSGSNASSNVDLTELDRYITELLTTLDIACEDTSAQLESIIDGVSRGVPRLTYDLHFMKDGAITLQSSLSDVLKRAKEAVPVETSAALDNLHYLDTIKGHMEASREVLQEAESWSTLEMEVTSLITERSYAKAAERLSEASRSMIVFQNTPEYDPRRALMVNLQNQLEASLSSALVSAINVQDVATCRGYFSIFSVIQRESEFRNYYNASRRSSIMAIWQNAHLSDCGDSSPSASGLSQSFVEFLPKYYSSFIAVLNAERTPICSIFPDPSNTLSHFISSTFSSLQPTFSQRLSSYASHHGELCLSYLIPALRATEEFAAGVEKIVEKLNYTDSPTKQRQPSAMERPSGHRRRSSRMSISWRPGQNRPSALAISNIDPLSLEGMEWDQELFQPFLGAQVDYMSLERRFLEQSFLDIVINDTRDGVQDLDRPRLFRERAVDIVGVAEGSMARCKAFTHGYGAAGLVQAIDDFFSSFVDTWTVELGTKASSSHTYTFNLTSGLELVDLDYTAKDWSDIQLSLHLLASARAVSERVTVFETKLRSYLSQVAAHFRLSQADPSNFTIAATRGESQLLEQSTLNSAELHALLSSVENERHAREPISTPLSSGFRQALVPPQSPETLLIQMRRSLANFARTCQVSTQTTILLPLWNHLVSYASLSIWSSFEDPNQSVANELRIPTFSLSPTDTVQRIAEGLLNLPQLFEVYADDDALAFSLQTLPYVGSEILKSPEQPSDASNQPTHRRRTSMALVKPTNIDPEVVSSAWLVSLGHTFLHHLTADILTSISKLSPTGAAQLASDLEYLSNIVKALNVENEMLEKWKVSVNMEESEVKKDLQDNSGDPVLVHICKIRGWR